MTALASTLEAFFTHRLTVQRDASPHTITAYRDTLRLLLVFARDHTGKQPSVLDVADIDAPLVAAFLTHLETERGNSISTRNARLTAIHSLFRYAALQHPEHAEQIQRVLAIPTKRHDQKIVCYLARDEIDALLAAPDTSTWFGRRDQTLLTLAIQTGMRVSEITRLVRTDLHLGGGAHVRCHGKGRKERATPLTSHTITALTNWLHENDCGPTDPVFPTRRGRPLSTDAVASLLTKHTATAAQQCPSLHVKHVTPHTLRHTAAMQLLHSGLDTSVIALWLGHESVETTQIYLNPRELHQTGESSQVAC
ncbi:tyrosine-type recombinase/integrase [Nocardia sp. CA-107356]|uniref:tyrosine-type recombinase/integrase n=1 Tax=Nocardia sp. CA-107356 TaxID=3239972 RepID=UPI003D8B4C2D